MTQVLIRGAPGCDPGRIFECRVETACLQLILLRGRGRVSTHKSLRGGVTPPPFCRIGRPSPQGLGPPAPGPEVTLEAGGFCLPFVELI
jgi:hypothetical protein